MTNLHQTTFAYEGRSVSFFTLGQDHIWRVMQSTGTFYECDVLEYLRKRLRKRKTCGLAIDAGGFIGTHSVYFAQICGLSPVLAFEVNPRSLDTLKKNLEINCPGSDVRPLHKALGAAPGRVLVSIAAVDNEGDTTVDYSPSREGETLECTTIDLEVEALGAPQVSLIKIDVEGAEVEVLQGAQRTLQRDRPILCVEAHSAECLGHILEQVARWGYCILDCRGFSPTYILEASPRGKWLSGLLNRLWLWAAQMPQNWRRPRRYTQALARRLAAVIAR